MRKRGMDGHGRIGKWHALKVTQLTSPGQKQVKIEEKITKAAPSSAKPPPPSTFGSDRWGTDREFRGKDNRGKGKQKGKTGTWQPKGGQPLTKVAEDDHDTRMSQYTTQTVKEEDCGLISKQNDWEYDRYQDSNNWELVRGAWKRIPRKVRVDDSKQML